PRAGRSTFRIREWPSSDTPSRIPCTPALSSWPLPHHPDYETNRRSCYILLRSHGATRIGVAVVEELGDRRMLAAERALRLALDPDFPELCLAGCEIQQAVG